MKLSKIEEILQKNGTIYTKVLEDQIGVEINVYHAVDTTHSKVYGTDGGEQHELSHTIQGIVVGDDFFPSSGQASGTFQEGWLYTTSKEVKAGDLISVKTEDDRARRYKVSGPFSIGMTIDIYNKFKLAALGD